MQSIEGNMQTDVEVEIVDRYEKNISYYIIKRTIDIIGSLCGIILLCPFMLITAVAIKLDSKGPIIFAQERVGQYGKIFRMYKFRSMVADAEEKCGAKWADKDDSRITRIGKFIRKTRIDELPQLVNILKGDMSIVGPRPEREYFYKKFEEGEAPGFSNRLEAKPGLTGLAQINGGYDITPAEKLQIDMEYLEKRSLTLDIKIILKTVGIVFSGEGAR